MNTASVSYPANVNLAATLLGCGLMIAALVMMCVWATSRNTDQGYLGGMNWNDKIFNWHPVLMLAGLVCSVGLGVSAYRITSPLLERWVSKILHSVFMLGAIVCLSVGLSAVWTSKNQNREPNLTSLHSWIGLIAVILIGQNYVLGAFHFLISTFPDRITVQYASFHTFLGKFSLVVSVLAACTGIQYVTYGCGENTVSGEDANPVQNYIKLKDGCKVAYGIVLLVVFGLLLILFGTQGTATSTTSNNSAEPRMRHGLGPAKNNNIEDSDIELEALYER